MELLGRRRYKSCHLFPGYSALPGYGTFFGYMPSLGLVIPWVRHFPWI